jgi:hypothetical protein
VGFRLDAQKQGGDHSSQCESEARRSEKPAVQGEAAPGKGRPMSCNNKHAYPPTAAVAHTPTIACVWGHEQLAAPPVQHRPLPALWAAVSSCVVLEAAPRTPPKGPAAHAVRGDSARCNFDQPIAPRGGIGRRRRHRCNADLPQHCGRLCAAAARSSCFPHSRNRHTFLSLRGSLPHPWGTDTTLTLWSTPWTHRAADAAAARHTGGYGLGPALTPRT